MNARALAVLGLLAGAVAVDAPATLAARGAARPGAPVGRPGPSQTPAPDTEWPAYGNDPGGTRYSSLAQIDAASVRRLTRAWAYRTGESVDELRARRASSEATPLLLDGRLIVATPLGRVVALDPATGDELWRFDAGVRRGRAVTRGVSSWRDPEAESGDSCARRLYLGTSDARLIALDAATGVPCVDFGRGGEVDLKRGIRVRPGGNYRVTSPPGVVAGLVVVGTAIGGNRYSRDTRGIVRAFDARSGRTVWRWDPLARSRAPDGAAGGRPFRAGAANVWAPMSVDETRGLVFLPTSSASPDHFGGKRPGDNLYADSVVALRAASGEVAWHFQIVHHDLWDYDVSTQPTLVTWRAEPDGPGVPAVVVGSKAGHLFVLHRETGKPLLPVREVDVPGDGVPGEVPSRTQPLPVKPPSLVAGEVRPDNVFGLDSGSRERCREQVAALRREGLFTPPTLDGSLSFPGPTGGLNWGGVSHDPERNLVIANTTRLAAALRLIPRALYDPADLDAWRADNPSVTVGLQRGTRYVMRRELLVTAEGLPCNPPPWGQLAAVDLTRGEIVWQVPLGITPGVAAHPRAADWGSRNIGGSLVTGGGLVFIAATLDDTLRAFDVADGDLLWRAPLPAGGQATPMTYSVDGKQYVVIVAGGHWDLGTTLGDFVVAFALP